MSDAFALGITDCLSNHHGTDRQLELGVERCIEGLNFIRIEPNEGRSLADEIFFGFSKDERKQLKEDIRCCFVEHISFFDLYNDGLYYVSQPFGPGNHPDILLIIYGVLIFIECKGSNIKSGHRYNNTIPPHNTIYIFSVPGTGSCMIMGDDLVTEEQREMLEIQTAELKMLNRKFHKESLTTKSEKFGHIKVSGRVNYLIHGGEKYTDIIRRTRELGLEANVYRFLCKRLKNGKRIPQQP